MDCFCGIADLRKAFSLISSQDHCQRSSLWRISDTQGAGFEPLENMSSGLAEWSCAVVITTTPQPNERFDLIITVKITKNWWNKKNESLGVSLQRFFFLSFLYKQNSFFEKNVSGYDYLRTLSMQIFKTLVLFILWTHSCMWCSLSLTKMA